MTAEIAILNQYGVALAADSAVTVGNQRVWQSSNKLFSVHPNLEVGVMIYGAASYLGVPLETIIKQWRHSLIDPQFDTLTDCAEDLKRYICGFHGSDKWKDFSAANHALLQIKRVADVINGKADGRKEINNYVEMACEGLAEFYSEAEEFENFPTLAEFKKEYSNLIDGLCDLNFKHKLFSKKKAKILELCWNVARRKITLPEYSGIVVAGFGAKQSSPSVIQFYCDASYMGFARIWKNDETCIELDEPSAIISYAQSDVVESIMEGINRQNLNFVKGWVSGALEQSINSVVEKMAPDKDQATVEIAIQERIREKLIKEMEDSYAEYRQSQIIGPVLNVVASLPKEELSIMAEALVDITSLVRKVGSPLQTVGGPVDVAVISKGDGFIWIKRKGYFNKDDNLGYLTRADISVRRTSRDIG